MNKRILNFTSLTLQERIKTVVLFGISLIDTIHCGLSATLFTLGDQYVEVLVDIQTGEIVHADIAEYTDLNKYISNIDLNL